MLAVLKEAISQLKQTSGPILSLSNVENAATGPDFMKGSKELGKQVSDRVEKPAILGIKGLKGMLLKGYNLFSGNSTKPFFN